MSAEELRKEIEEWIEAGEIARAYIQRLRKENEVAGETIMDLAHGNVEAMQRIEMLEGVLKRIAEDSRPYAGWTAEFHSAAEHWKHVASQRREWAIEALDHGVPE